MNERADKAVARLNGIKGVPGSPYDWVQITIGASQDKTRYRKYGIM